jgi:hypothetical protein
LEHWGCSGGNDASIAGTRLAWGRTGRIGLVNNAAREGARVRILPGYSNADATARVNNYVSASGLSGSAATSVSAITIPGGGGGAPSTNGYRVTVQYPYNFTLLGPVLAAGGVSSVMLTASSAMRSEM